MKVCIKNVQGVLDYGESKTYTLTIENKKEYRNIVEDINNKINTNLGETIITEKDKELNFSKTVFILFDYINLDTSLFMQKQLIKGISKNILELDIKNKIIEEISKLTKEIDKYILEYEYQIETIPVEIEEIIKLLKPKLLKQENFINNLYQYVKFINQELKFKLIVLVELKEYVEEKELDDLLYQFELEDINTLLIQSKNNYKTGREKNIIIDKDLCQIDEISK